MIIKHLKKKNKLRKESHGFSLTEMVIAMGILTIFMPVVIGMMNTTILARKSADINTQSTMRSSAIDQILKKDLENAVAVKIWNNAEIKIATREGVPSGDADGVICKSYRVFNGNLQYAENPTGLANPIGANKKIILEGMIAQNFGADKTQDRVFEYNNSVITYEMLLGEGSNTTVIKGSITPKVMSGSQGACWT